MLDCLALYLFGASPRERFGDGSTDRAPPPGCRGMRFDEQLHHFLRIPGMFADIEFYFAVTMLGLAESLFTLILLPLKCVIAFKRVERRDMVALALIAVGMLTYYFLSLCTTQLYAYLYHVVRRTSFIRLVMVFNILDLADKFLSALSLETIEVLTGCVQDWGRASAVPASRALQQSLWIPVGSAVLSALCVAAHSVTLLLSVVTLNVALNAEGYLLLALMVSLNLSEVKSVAFKNHNRDSLLRISATDAIERFQYLIFVLVIVAQHIAERSSALDMAGAMFVLVAEVFIDFTKHLFAAKFNGISLSSYRSYTQLILLDMAIETVLWRLPCGVRVRCIDDSSDKKRDINALLAPSAGFFLKYVKRTGFVPVAYAALLMWNMWSLGRLLFVHAPLLCLLFLCVAVLLKLFLSELIRGLSTRFVVRTLIVFDQDYTGDSDLSTETTTRTTTTIVGGSVNTGGTENVNGERGKESNGVPPVRFDRGIGSALFGVSPPVTPRVSPQQRCSPLRTGSPVATLQLSSSLCALLVHEPFDLQAGKMKR